MTPEQSLGEKILDKLLEVDDDPDLHAWYGFQFMDLDERALRILQAIGEVALKKE